MALRGAKQVLRNLERIEAQKRTARRRALTEIGLKVKRDSNDLVPVDTGNLRGSAYIDVDRDVSVQIGYTAHYAPVVHELTGEKLRGQPRADFGTTRSGESFGGGTGKGNYWDGGESKFLEKAVKNNAAFILAELAKAMKL